MISRVSFYLKFFLEILKCVAKKSFIKNCKICLCFFVGSGSLTLCVSLTCSDAVSFLSAKTKTKKVKNEKVSLMKSESKTKK